MGRAPTDTKNKLIETARELILRDSYGAVSVDEICAKAGVHKGSFYHYFPSKADLALETMENCMQEAKTDYDDIFSPDRPPVSRFERLVEHIYRQQAQIQQERGCVYGCPFATLGSELAAQDEKIGQKIADICMKNIIYYERGLRDLAAADLIDPATDIKTRAQDIYAFIFGHLTMARINNDLSFIKNHLKDSLFALIGITAQPGTKTK